MSTYWLVEASEYDYDEFDQFVVRAETADQAHMVAILQTIRGHGGRWSSYAAREAQQSRQVWMVKSLEDVEGDVLCASYNAG